MAGLCSGAMNRKRVLAIEEDPLPDFKVDEEPEAVPMLSDARAMRLGQTSEESGLKEPSLKRPGSAMGTAP